LSCISVFLAGLSSAVAQQSEKKDTDFTVGEEEEGPLMLKFEPNFMTSVEVHREEIKRRRAIIDTLNVSDRKRRRLLRELYKNGISERLSKAMTVDTKFDDDVNTDDKN